MIRERSSKSPVGPQSIETAFSLETENRTKSRVSPLARPDLLLRDGRRIENGTENLRDLLRREAKLRPAKAPQKKNPKDLSPRTKPKEVEKVVEIPRPKSDPQPDTLLPGMLHCPSTDGSRIPLLRQSIPTKTCATRQAQGYHKCSFCVHSRPRDLSDCSLPPLENSPSHLAESRM